MREGPGPEASTNTNTGASSTTSAKNRRSVSTVSQSGPGSSRSGNLRPSFSVNRKGSSRISAIITQSQDGDGSDSHVGAVRKLSRLATPSTVEAIHRIKYKNANLLNATVTGGKKKLSICINSQHISQDCDDENLNSASLSPYKKIYKKPG